MRKFYFQENKSTENAVSSQTVAENTPPATLSKLLEINLDICIWIIWRTFIFLRISHECDEKWQGFLLGHNCFPSYTADHSLNFFYNRHTKSKLVLNSLFEEMVSASGIFCGRLSHGIKELNWVTVRWLEIAINYLLKVFSLVSLNIYAWKFVCRV